MRGVIGIERCSFCGDKPGSENCDQCYWPTPELIGVPSQDAENDIKGNAERLYQMIHEHEHDRDEAIKWIERFFAYEFRSGYAAAKDDSDKTYKKKLDSRGDSQYRGIANVD